MGATETQKMQLSAKLPASRVSKRDGSGGRKLSYVEWHDCVRSANEIFGFGEWSSETVDMIPICSKEVQKTNGGGTQWFACYRARVRVAALGAFYDGWGYGEGYDPKEGQAHESALKEAESDAAKRALRNLGDQFGLALYDKAQAHVEQAGDKKAEPQADATDNIAKRIGKVVKVAGLTKEEYAAIREVKGEGTFAYVLTFEDAPARLAQEWRAA